MNGMTGKYFTLGNLLHDASGFNPHIFEQGYSVYEVIRIINGKALFLKEHLERLSESVRLSGLKEGIDHASMAVSINDLSSACHIDYGNLKVVIHFPLSGPASTYTYFIPHVYPSIEDYRYGVRTALVRSVRNTPNIKRLTAQQVGIPEKDGAHMYIYENLLVDQHDHITEGSKSNVFFIKGDHLHTAPDEMILKGITREKVISIIKSLNYNLITDPVSINDLKHTETVFLTGTSPKVLPISSIGDLSFDVNHFILRQVMQAFDRMIEETVS